MDQNSQNIVSDNVEKEQKHANFWLRVECPLKNTF